MSRHAALKFCQWLTAQTGNFYRLPTEAEWEYACRANTTTPYSFDHEQNKISQYAFNVFSQGYDQLIPAIVAGRKPNPWGLYDMHGNLSEWTLDAYLPSYQSSSRVISNPISFSPKLHQGLARGGSYDSEPHELRSAARLPASRQWNNLDPRLPPSIWYNASAGWLGFRVVRPLKTPSLEEAHLIWNVDSGKFWNWQDSQ